MKKEELTKWLTRLNLIEEKMIKETENKFNIK